MKNLKLLDRKLVKNVECLSEAQFLTFDVNTGVIYVATNSEIYSCDVSNGQKISSIAIRQDGVASDESVPVSLQYLCDQEAVCVVSSDGRLCLWQTADPHQLECVGEVDGGVTALAWSPDLELAAMTTGLNKLLLMTREFDVITEVDMFPSSKGEDSNVALGWGKKETQFHGSAGKQAAKAESVMVSPAGQRDPGTPQISWRGDGQFFVVSTIDPDTRGRFLYVWSRDCVFQSRSEPVDGLQHSLSWKPTGSLIASVQTKKQNTQEVVFFEKNGLRHGEFQLLIQAGSDAFVKSILWNGDSTVLAVLIDEQVPGRNTPASLLQLWTVNNYHWYLKQSLNFNPGVATLAWDVEQNYRMHVITRDGAYLCYSWAWAVNHTSGSCGGDRSLVGVIDGAKVLVTPMRQMVVPPPMAAYVLNLPYPVNSLTFEPSPGSGGIACLMSNGQIAVFRYGEATSPTDSVKLDAAGGGEGFKPQCELHSLSGIYKVKNDGIDPYPLGVSHLLWLAGDHFLFATASDSQSLLHVGSLLPDSTDIVVKQKLPVESASVLALALNEVTNHVAVQLSTGPILKFILETESIQPWLSSDGSAVKFPYQCPTMAVTSVENEEVVLGLTERFRFYVNGIEVASNCTSFGIHNEFILLTTLDHTLRCISRSTQVKDLPKFSDSKTQPQDENVRQIERGSRIVTVVGNDTKVVLQMPRGNLEVIHPRALVLSCLKNLLARGMILDALLVVRKQKINMNLLYDHDPDYFLKNIDDILRQISSATYLNVFLTELLEEDVTSTMYTAAYQRERPPCGKQLVSKVDRVCDAVVASLERIKDNRYLPSVLTALVRKTKPELEKALLLVWSLHDKSESGVTAEDALKYLLFLVDVNVLYDAALGTYNFDLVKMVAAKSQKDPKEYIPFLKQLQQLEENYRHYTIDKHLKRYNKALGHISKCGKEHFEECLSLVVDHKLYSKAIQLYRPGTEEYQSLVVLYGNYLRTKNRHDEAGIMFLKGNKFELALEAFRSSGDWRQVFCMANKLEFSENKLSELASKVAGELKSRQRFSEAAVVYEQYSQDPEEAVVALIEGLQWEEALRLMHHYKRLDLIETHLKEAVQESWDHQMDMLSSQRDLFSKYVSRLGVVRAEKEKAKLYFLESQADHGDADLFSDTTSMTGTFVGSVSTANSSRSTVFTKNTGSSRTRRKAENKKWSLKEGSANEEHALVDALAKIIKAVDSLREDISCLLKVLIQFNHDQKAWNLQILYSDVLNLLQESMADVWSSSSQSSHTDMNLGPYTTANAIAQAVQKGQKPLTNDKLDPVISIAPTLSKDTKWKLHIASEDRS